MALTSFQQVPESLRAVLGEEGFRYFQEWHRKTYGDGPDIDGTLDRENIDPVENLKTDETDVQKVLRPTGSGGSLSFQDAPGVNAKYITLEDDPELPNDRVATGGTNITITDGTTIATWDVSPQGAGSGLDADTLDAREAAAFLWSIAKSGDTALQGVDATLSEGTGITLTQTGSDIAIAATGAISTSRAFAFFIA